MSWDIWTCLFTCLSIITCPAFFPKHAEKKDAHCVALSFNHTYSFKRRQCIVFCVQAGCWWFILLVLRALFAWMLWLGGGRTLDSTTKICACPASCLCRILELAWNPQQGVIVQWRPLVTWFTLQIIATGWLRAFLHINGSFNSTPFQSNSVYLYCTTIKVISRHFTMQVYYNGQK